MPGLPACQPSSMSRKGMHACISSSSNEVLWLTAHPGAGRVPGPASSLPPSTLAPAPCWTLRLPGQEAPPLSCFAVQSLDARSKSLGIDFSDGMQGSML
jgi:hypothetical protein